MHGTLYQESYVNCFYIWVNDKDMKIEETFFGWMSLNGRQNTSNMTAFSDSNEKMAVYWGSFCKYLWLKFGILYSELFWMLGHIK